MTALSPAREAIFLGDIFIGELTAWKSGAVRFFYRADVDGAVGPMVADFPTRRVFNIWIAAQVAGHTLADV